MSQAGIFSNSSSTPSGVIVIPGVSVNMTVAGASTLFTPTGNFFLTGIFARGTNVTVPGASASWSLGWTGPLYNDFTANSNFNPPLRFTGATGSNEWSFDTPQIIPVALPFKINITSPSTFATDLETIYVIGFYI